MSKNNKTFLLTLASIITLVIISALIALLVPPTAPPAALPVPNGYSALVEAGNLIQKQTADFPKMNQQELQAAVDGNSNALQIARSGLGEKVQVPLEFSTAYGQKHLPELARLKLLAQAFLAEGLLAEMEQRTNDAAGSYADALRLGVECRRGGPLIDMLVGIAIESMSASQLEKVAGKLDAKTSGNLAREIETLDAQKETWSEILRNERNWTHGAYPGLQHRLAELFASGEMRATKEKSEKKFNARQMNTRRLIVDLAAHAYELDKGHRPGSANDLVPTYLKALPQDPVTGKNMTLTP